MMKDIKEKLVKYTLYSVLIVAAGFCIYFIIIAPSFGQQLLAVSVLVTIIVGGFINMWKIFRSSDKLDEMSNGLAELSNKFDDLINVTEKGITQTRAIEEQRRKDEREPAKELLKSRLNKFITYWEEDKESILENDQKRKKELKKKLFEIGNELKTKVDKNEKLLSQTIVDEARDIAKGIINLSNKILCDVMTKRIQKQEYEEGNELAERAKELIKKL
jgi:hypothetical protein